MYEYRKFLVVIPARYTSTRLPGKLLIKINNKSVLQRVWEKCIRTAGKQNVIVAAGDNKIYNFSENISNKLTIISYIFSRCPMPDMCPAIISHNQFLANSFKKTLDLLDI